MTYYKTILIIAVITIAALSESVALSQVQHPIAPTAAQYSLCNKLPFGARVRVLASGEASRESKIVGTVQSCDSERLIVATRNSETDFISIPITAIQTLEISESRSGHFWLGVGSGMLVGVLIVAAQGDQYDDSDGWNQIEEELFVKPAAYTSAAFYGGLLGGLIGSQIKTDKWAPIWTGQPVPTVVGATQYEYKLGVAINF